MILKSSEFTHVLRFQDLSIYVFNLFHFFKSCFSLHFMSCFLLHCPATVPKHIHEVEQRRKTGLRAVYQVLYSSSGFCLLFFFSFLISLVLFLNFVSLFSILLQVVEKLSSLEQWTQGQESWILGLFLPLINCVALGCQFISYIHSISEHLNIFQLPGMPQALPQFLHPRRVILNNPKVLPPQSCAVAELCDAMAQKHEKVPGRGAP